jgi:hypothetical protein
MRRIFWLALGLGAGATAALMAGRWARQQAQRVAPANLAREAGEGLRSVGALLSQAAKEFREGAAQKEAEVRSTLDS